MTLGAPFPRARWLALAALLVYLPTYTVAYGVANFLFICNLSVILAAIGLWTGSALILSSQAVAILVVVVTGAYIMWENLHELRR